MATNWIWAEIFRNLRFISSWCRSELAAGKEAVLWVCVRVLWVCVHEAQVSIWACNCQEGSLMSVCMCLVAELCSTLATPMDYRPPGSSVHRICQARILQQVAISSSRRSSWPRDQTHVSYISCTGRQVLYHLGSWAIQYHIIPIHAIHPSKGFLV